jgi:hypothetical protein
VSWRALTIRLLQTDDILFLPPSARTVSKEETEALEAKRVKRLRELGKWRPSSGWQIEPSL